MRVISVTASNPNEQPVVLPGHGKIGSGDGEIQTDTLPTPRTMLDYALEYVSRGWAIIALAPATKIPLVGSHGYLDATTDVRRIEELWSKYPNANIGGVPGASNRVVLDIDNRHGGALTLQRIVDAEGAGILLTRTTISASGSRHLTFQACGKLYANSKKALGAGIDIIASTGYVVLPPSVLADGRDYMYDTEYMPQDSEQHLEEMPLPGWLARLLTEIKSPNRAPRNAQADSAVRAEDIVDILETHGGLRGDQLAATAGDVDFLAAACDVMGIHMHRPGATFRCILPGHADQHPSATIFLNDRGIYTYYDHHDRQADERKCYTLAEVHRAIAAGKVEHISRGEIAVWHLRLLVETGWLTPAPIDLPNLPASASKWAREVYNGFRLLLGCRWRYNMGAPTPYSRDFATVWCGISEWHAGIGIKELIAAGIMVMQRVETPDQERADTATVDQETPDQEAPGRIRLYLPGITPVVLSASLLIQESVPIQKPELIRAKSSLRRAS